MGKRRPSGDGMVRKRPDGRWEGRIVVGHKADGSSIFRYLYADTDVYKRQGLLLSTAVASPGSVKRPCARL